LKDQAKISRQAEDLRLFRWHPAWCSQLANRENVGEDVVMQSNVVTMPGQEEQQVTIDEVHLQRMTLGDRSLEREVLEIFAHQTTLILQRIAGAAPARAAAAAHTLKGSARGIGAWRVAKAAERLEQAAGEGDERTMRAAIAELEAASFEARTSILLRLAEYEDEPLTEMLGDRSRGY